MNDLVSVRRIARLALVAALAVTCGVGMSSRAEAQWRVRRDPFDQRAVQRYKTMLSRSPDDRYALRKLTSLYRRHRSMARLIAEYEAIVRRKPTALAPRLVLAHLLRLAGKSEAAIKTYRIAATLAPRQPEIHAHLAGLHHARNDETAATRHYQKALECATSARQRKHYLGQLAKLARTAEEPDHEVEHRRALVALSPADSRARLDLAAALDRADQATSAISEYRVVLRLVHGAQRRVEVLRQLAQLQRRSGVLDGALESYRRILRLTARAHWLRREALQQILAIHRQRDELATLLAHWTRQWTRRGFVEWDLLARLFEETGDDSRALQAYRAALRKAPAEIDTRLRLIALLDRTGQADAALKHHRRLARVAAGEPRHQLELARRLNQAGRQAHAVAVLERCIARFRRDAAVRAAAADMFLRWGDERRALREAKALVRIAPREEAHLLRLGEQYFLAGNKPAARRTWRRILEAIPVRHLALARLAAVYAQHDMLSEAIALYRKAIALAPDLPHTRRSLAFLLERQRKHDAALDHWRGLHAMAMKRKDRRLRAECRRRTIDLLIRTHRLRPTMHEYRKRLDGDPPDLIAGLFLAEAHTKQRDHDKAIGVFEQVLRVDPDQLDALEGLERLYHDRRDLTRSVALLKRLAALRPKRARVYFRRIAQAQLRLLDDDEALVYARRAAAAGRADPRNDERLSEVLTARGDYSGAIRALQHALEVTPSAHMVRFRLGDLYARTGKIERAERLYRAILRRTDKAELALRAFRAALPLAALTQRLDELERTILSRALDGGRQTEVYRDILLRLYEHRVPVLVRQLDAAHGQERTRTRQELIGLGRRGIAPMLTLLAARTTSTTRRRRIVDLLGQLGNPNAAPALLRIARRQPTEPPLRIDAGRAGRTASLASYAAYTHASARIDERVGALLALGRLAAPPTSAALAELARASEGPVRDLAIWALARTGGPTAVTIFRAALRDPRPEVQTFACVGLGAHGSPEDHRIVRSIINDAARDPLTRASCAWAAGALQDDDALDPLANAARSGHDTLGASAAWAIGALRNERSLTMLADFVWLGRHSLRTAALRALSELHKPTTTSQPQLPLVSLNGAGVDRQRFVRELTRSADRWEEDALEALLSLAEQRRPALISALSKALGRHRDTLLRVLDQLSWRGDGPRLAPLSDNRDHLSAQQRARMGRAIREIGLGLTTPLARLLRHADPLVRTRAARVLATVNPRAAIQPLLALLDDPIVDVRTSALRALAGVAPQHEVGAADRTNLRALARTRLAQSDHWNEREAAVQLLAQLVPSTRAVDLQRVSTDQNAFVRQAVAEALGTFSDTDRWRVLALLLRDDVPHVRLAACQAATRATHPALRAQLERLLDDPDAQIRSAAARALDR